MVTRFKRQFYGIRFLFGAAKLTTNSDQDKYSYFGYDIRLDSHSLFPLSDSYWGINVVIFGIDNSSSVHIILQDQTKNFKSIL